MVCLFVGMVSPKLPVILTAVLIAVATLLEDGHG